MRQAKSGKRFIQDGVPVETDDHIVYYNKEGLLHRLDGPALTYKNNPTEIWYKNGKIHRDGDEPAYIYGKSGDTSLTFEWYHEGNLHRQGGAPAVLKADGTKEWWFNNQTHRLDGPAIEGRNGHKEWWVEGRLHRLNGPAVKKKDGTREWRVEGKLHRLDGPAIEYVDGHKEWWVAGYLHRLDGPAVEHSDGHKEWWVDGKVSIHPKKCLASVNARTSKEKLVKLCMSDDYVVQSLALTNPNCPPEGKLIAILKRGGNLK